MIDLSYNREQMLAEIKASDNAFTNCFSNPADPGFIVLDEASLVVQGKTPEELLSFLCAVYAKRFPQVSQHQLFYELNNLIKRGIGNAYKWGNKKDTAKNITVETVVTATGALVAISDEGEGFDIESVLNRFQKGKHYFSHGGAGFKQFHKTKSLISYVHGGSTLLIRFLCVPEPTKDPSALQEIDLGSVCNEEFMKSFLTAELLRLRKNTATPISCRIHIAQKCKTDQGMVKYLLVYHEKKSAQTKLAAFSGRLLPEAEAQIDFSVAEKLYYSMPRMENSIRIPKPVAAFKQLPLVLYEFNPVMNLTEYLNYFTRILGFKNFQDIAKVNTIVAEGLYALHRSKILLDVKESLSEAIKRYLAIKDSMVDKLEEISPHHAERVQIFFNKLMKYATRLKDYDKTPIHGALTWNHILYDYKEFYFYDFSQCRHSHPGFDVGAFLAELLWFCVFDKKGNLDDYSAGRDVFLKAYSRDVSPLWYDDLPFFIGCATFLRLSGLIKQKEKNWLARIDRLLDKCEQILYA